MKPSRVLVALLTAFFFVAVVTPEPADPGLRQFGRWVNKQTDRVGKKIAKDARKIKKAVTFVAEVPGKIEFHMKKAGIPPVVAVYGTSKIMPKLLASNKAKRLFRTSKNIVKTGKDIREFDRQVRELKQYYREESEKVYQSAFKLLENQDKLSKRILPEKMKYKDFKATWLQMEEMASAQLKLSEKLKQTANRLGRNWFLKIASKMAIEKTFGAAKKIVAGEIAEEILKSTDPDVIITALRTGITVDAVLSKIVEKDVEKELSLQGAKHKFDSKKLAKRITSKIKQRLKTDRDFYKKNWKTFVKNSVKEDIEKRKDAAGYLVAGFELEPETGMAPLSVEFNASSSEGKIKAYKWDFGDKTPKGSGKTTSHTYHQKGSYDVKLTLVGETGIQITTEAHTVKVLPKPSPPSVSLSVKPPEVDPGEQVTIEAKVDPGSIKQGKLTVTFKVGSTSLKSGVMPEELDYDIEFTRKYTVPGKSPAGKVVVTSVPTIILTKDDAKKFKMDKFAGKAATASFKVTGKKPKKKKADQEDLAEDPFVGTWAGIEKVLENSSLSLEEIRAEGLTTTFPLRFNITRSGNIYKVTGIRGLTIDKVLRSGMTLTIHATGDYNAMYHKFDQEKFTLTLQQGGSVLAGKHRIDFAAPDKAPADYRIYQINDVKLNKQ